MDGRRLCYYPFLWGYVLYHSGNKGTRERLMKVLGLIFSALSVERQSKFVRVKAYCDIGLLHQALEK
jgi:hypothetical protein